jgi:hypothetical protein
LAKTVFLDKGRKNGFEERLSPKNEFYMEIFPLKTTLAGKMMVLCLIAERNR